MVNGTSDASVNGESAASSSPRAAEGEEIESYDAVWLVVQEASLAHR